ncbi:hypothetical protein N7470_000696 [Penicillium chermesinum]|nr:hypothetical protein N7470_000696 [Penicillium chermesinum]
MISGIDRPGQTPTMNRLPVSSLMSPPDTKPLDSFQSSPFPKDSSTLEMKLPPISADRKRTQSEMDLPSPPVTPYTGAKQARSHSSENIERDVGSTRDPVLFPRHESLTGTTEEPLFGPVHPPTAEALVEQHMNSHMAQFVNKRSKPTRDDTTATQRRGPERRETLERQLILMNRHRPGDLEAKLKKLAPAPVKKTGVAPRVSRPRVKRTPKSTPKSQTLDTFDSSPTSKPRALGTNRDDTDYNALPDYSPPLETLGTNAKALKADWKGQMLDLSNDADRHLLSPAELNLASTLRLSCATYLCSKRRIFEGRVRALQVGKEFRKTDAQQACKIDVNKASKLWTAYERVGWFNPEFFRHL